MARPLVFSRHGMQAVDREAIETLGIPGILLMEHAGRALAVETLRLAGERRASRMTCVCGPGNNGGDGWVAARLLHSVGAQVQVVEAVPSRAGSDAATNRAIALRLGIARVELGSWRGGAGELVVDAVLGTGVTTAPRGESVAALGAIESARRRGASILSADLPSGLDADLGVTLAENTVRAEVTVTFAGYKRGLLRPTAAPFAGLVVVVPIGVPRALLEKHADAG